MRLDLDLASPTFRAFSTDITLRWALLLLFRLFLPVNLQSSHRQTMDAVTTAFSPGPTCLASADLWLHVLPGTDGYACNTYYPPFSSKPPNAVQVGNCPYTLLGPSGSGKINDPSCYQTSASTDCPGGMTAAEVGTTLWLDGITKVVTTCCPT